MRDVRLAAEILDACRKGECWERNKADSRESERELERELEREQELERELEREN